MPTFDAKQIVQAAMGPLGQPYGTPMAPFGDLAQYSPEKYFDTGDYYQTTDHYDGEAYFSSKNIMRDWVGDGV